MRHAIENISNTCKAAYLVHALVRVDGLLVFIVITAATAAATAAARGLGLRLKRKGAWIYA
jgi:hypothetical protein